MEWALGGLAHSQRLSGYQEPWLWLDIPDLKRSSCRAEFVWLAVPGEVFVVEGVVRRQSWRMPTSRLARVRRAW